MKRRNQELIGLTKVVSEPGGLQANVSCAYSLVSTAWGSGIVFLQGSVRNGLRSATLHSISRCRADHDSGLIACTVNIELYSDYLHPCRTSGSWPIPLN